MDWTTMTAPAPRVDGLVVERLSDETLVYDLENDEAVAAPLIESIVAPSPAHAQSIACAGLGEGCKLIPCCEGLSCTDDGCVQTG